MLRSLRDTDDIVRGGGWFWFSDLTQQVYHRIWCWWETARLHWFSLKWISRGDFTRGRPSGQRLGQGRSNADVHFWLSAMTDATKRKLFRRTCLYHKTSQVRKTRCSDVMWKSYFCVFFCCCQNYLWATQMKNEDIQARSIFSWLFHNWCYHSVPICHVYHWNVKDWLIDKVAKWSICGCPELLSCRISSYLHAAGRNEGVTDQNAQNIPERRQKDVPVPFTRQCPILAARASPSHLCSLSTHRNTYVHTEIRQHVCLSVLTYSILQRLKDVEQPAILLHFLPR